MRICSLFFFKTGNIWSAQANGNQIGYKSGCLVEFVLISIKLIIDYWNENRRAFSCEKLVSDLVVGNWIFNWCRNK